MARLSGSGSGKSVSSLSLMRLVEPGAGEVRLDGVDIMQLDPGDLRAARRDMQINLSGSVRVAEPDDGTAGRSGLVLSVYLSRYGGG